MEQPPPVPQSLPEEPKAPTMSPAGRMLNVFATPGEVFDEVRAAGPTTSNWLVPAFILILVGWIGSAIVLSQPVIKQQLSEIMDNAIRQRIEKAHMPKEQAEKTIEMAEKWGGMWSVAASYAGPVLVAFLSPFGWGLIIWLGGSKIYKGNFDYMKAVEMVGLSNMIGVFEAIVKTLLILAMGNTVAAPSRAPVVKDFKPQ